MLSDKFKQGLLELIQDEVEEHRQSHIEMGYIHDRARDLASAVEAFSPYRTSFDYYYGVRGSTMHVTVKRESGV